MEPTSSSLVPLIRNDSVRTPALEFQPHPRRTKTDTTISTSEGESQCSSDTRARNGHRWSTGGLYGRSTRSDKNTSRSVATGDQIVRTVRAGQKDDTGDAVRCWEGQVVLSLDGGGFRGLATLYILKELMEEIGRRERNIDHTTSSIQPPKKHARNVQQISFHTDDSKYHPSHYFDYICGTGLGGIIAVLLGRLRVSVDDAIEYYKQSWAKVAKQIYDVDKFLPRIILKERNSRGLREALDWIIKTEDETRERQGKERIVDRNGTYHQPSFDLCKTLILAVEYDGATASKRPFLFRSYSFTAPKANGLNRNAKPISNRVTIQDVCMATSAAPAYFKKYEIQELKRKYGDGSLWMSNPSLELYREVLSMHADDISDSSSPIHCIVSIGCGTQKKGFAEKTLRALSPSRMLQRNSFYDTEQRQVDDLLAYHHKEGQNFEYFRFDGPSNIKTPRPTDWRSERRRARFTRDIENVSRSFCKSPYQAKKIEDLADLLVDYRRQRAQTSFWDNYVYVDYAQIQTDHRCTRCGDVFERDLFIDHVKREHSTLTPGPDSSKAFRELLEKTKIETVNTKGPAE